VYVVGIVIPDQYIVNGIPSVLSLMDIM